MSDLAVVMGGMGQVGSALASVLSKKHSVIVTDAREPNKPNVKNIEFLHVCIPWQDGFVEKVKEESGHFGAKIVVVHSTVPVGTTRIIGENAVHSPVRGQHDSLEKSLTRFVKYVGGSRASVVKKHLEAVGVVCKKFAKPEDTELAKLLCLSRYLNDLAFYENAASICQKYGVDTKVILDWSRTYNQGYAGTKWVRPDLTFPDGVVGGHCVLQNSKVLFEQTQDEFTKRNLEVFNQ